MRLRNTLIAALIFAALGAWIYFYEYGGEASREEAARAEKRALDFETDAVQALSLVKPDGAIRLAKEQGEWRLVEPVRARADDGEVSGILRTLSLLEIDDRFDAAPEELEQYNLDAPPLVVSLDFGGEAAELNLAVGDRTPIGSGFYARRDGGGPVITVSSSVDRLLEATPDGLRYKKVVGLDSWKVERFRIEKRGSAVAFAKEDGDWRMVSPVLFPADRTKVSSLLYDLTALTATGFEPEGTGPEAAGLGEPLFRLLVTSDEGEEIAVEFSGESGEGIVRARREGMSEIFRLDRRVLESLDLAEGDYRDSRVAPVDRWQLAEIRVRGEEGEKSVLKDAESNWRWGSPDGPILESGVVEALIDALERTRAVAYREGSRATSGIGTDSPRLELELKAGEAPPVRVRLGAEDSGRVLVASSAAAPVYEVEKSAVEALLEAVRSLKATAATAASTTGSESEESS